MTGEAAAQSRRAIRKKPCFLIFGVLIVMGAPATPSRSASAGEAPSAPLVFAGSGSNLAITRVLAEAFGRVHPEIRIEVPASLGSTGGIMAAADGAIAVGLVSRPLREQEKGLGLTVVPYARTAVVIGAHLSVADDGISLEDLVQIYKGTKSRWKDGREIIVLTREPGDSSIEVLERTIPGFKEAHTESHRARRWFTFYTHQEMGRALARTPYAIGVSELGAITVERLPIKALKVNGVFPTPETVASGGYPLVKTLAFVFRKKTLPTGARAFLDFVRSKQGERLLKSSGLLPAE